MTNRATRILLTGSYGQGNTGDEAILSVIVDQLRARMPDLRIVVVAGDTETIRQQFGVETVVWSDWAAIAQAMQQCDVVIQGGGGIFFDYTGFHPWDLFENGAPDLAHYGGYSLLAKLYGKPFMIYGVGVGPLLTDEGRQMVRVAHSLADKITVRDPESKLLLEQIGVESHRVEVTADPAFCLSPADANHARGILADHGINPERSIIGVTPRPWDHSVSQTYWEDSLAGMLSEIAFERQAQVLLIPFQKGYDNAPILKIQKLVENDTFVLRDGYTPQEIAGVIGACDLLIGMRLHSILFAILTATPAVALSYDPKVRSLMRRIGHEETCIDLTEVSELKDRLAAVWATRKELSIAFARIRDEMRVLSERNADVACELLSAGADVPAIPEYRDLLGRAFYGRLQGIRVRDRLVHRQDETTELRDIIGVMEAEHWQVPSPSSEVNDSSVPESLHEFLQRVVVESTQHLVLIYDGGPSSEELLGLIKAFADYGIPVVLTCDDELAANQAISDGRHENVFQLPIAAMVESWDDVLCISTPTACSRVLLLRSADQNTFRLINHAHAMGWATVYYPDGQRQQDRHESDVEKYMVSNAEQLIVRNEFLKNDAQSIGALDVRIIRENESAKDQVAKILGFINKPLTRSTVRSAIKGASER